MVSKLKIKILTFLAKSNTPVTPQRLQKFLRTLNFTARTQAKLMIKRMAASQEIQRTISKNYVVSPTIKHQLIPTKKKVVRAIPRTISYRTYRHAKRIYDTHYPRPQHRFDVDIEFTCQGFAEIGLSHEQIDSIINPKLITQGFHILYMADIGISEFWSDWRVSGSEWRQGSKPGYDPVWAVEVRFVNNIGKQYTFQGFFHTMEYEWPLV